MAEGQFVYCGSTYHMPDIGSGGSVVAPEVIVVLREPISQAASASSAVNAVKSDVVAQRLSECVVQQELQSVGLLTLKCNL